MFIDKCKVFVKAGNGGNGCVSFRREKFIPKGGPNGGDGGNGGSVIFVATSGQTSLVELKFQQHIDARHGGNGEGRDRHGENSPDLIVEVPLGTLVMDADNDNYLVADLTKEGETFVAAKGGRGGRGNAHFATPANRAPRKADPGGRGEEKTYLLELKIVADVGLVGYPNAGKSSFLNAISNAGMKTAAYPFTTLNPHVAYVFFEDYTRMTVADIPGLVEGAHADVGLGHDFLRHVERTKVLAYVLDMAGTDGRDPIQDLENLEIELDLYLPGLADRAALIIANKMDDAQAKRNLTRLKRRTKLAILPCCAVLSDGTQAVVDALRNAVLEARAIEAAAGETQPAPALRNVHASGGRISLDLADIDDLMDPGASADSSQPEDIDELLQRWADDPDIIFTQEPDRTPRPQP